MTAALEWPDLRTAALVGLARRPVPPAAPAGWDLPADRFADAEGRALAAAALLAAQRRAGLRPQTGIDPQLPADDEVRPVAPTAASQLLDLVLTGNLGRPSVTDGLVAHWARCCAAAGAVVPVRLVIPLLERARASVALRPAVAPIVGERGLWLGSLREDWAWVAGEQAEAVDLSAYATASPKARAEMVRRIRAQDPTAGRELVASTWDEERAAERVALLGALATGLGPDDEPFLEAALAAGAKSVREAAAGLLERLPASARSHRLAELLRPMISVQGGRLRKRTLHLGAVADQDRLAQDLPGVAETHLRRVLVRAAPLATWTEATGARPEDLVTWSTEPADLLPWLVDATIAQHDIAWATALAGRTIDVRVLSVVPGPWSAAFATTVLGVLRAHERGAFVVDQAGDVLAERLPASAVDQLDAWRNQLTDDATRPLARHLATVARLVRTRTSITEAFA